MSTAIQTISLQHNRITLALHQLQDGAGRPLLLLHGLGESAVNIASLPLSWAGPIWALDFTGHGASTVPRGGGYSAEILMADVDVALRYLGEATVLGRGLGGYVAFLIAGARPSLVRGAVIVDGPGLTGGSIHATSSSEIPVAGPRVGQAPDPWALIELSRDARPPNYAVTFTHLAVATSGLDDPIAVTCKVSPPWIEAIKAEAGVMTDITMQDALDIYAAI
ncbi:MAG: alpha/beta hydrolase [Ilumatobacteraceae bacterium]|jgi:pimeloyl-ACP methyl ester carboxylesterase|nr:alpha/beta hydrolase [Ilumatobacteraceae bacterium]